MAAKSFANSLGRAKPQPVAPVQVTASDGASSTEPQAKGAAEESVAPVQVAVVQEQSELEMRLAQANEIMSAGGLSIYTAEAAKAAGRPLRKWKRNDLIVHPYNQRPVSGDEDLDDLTISMQKHGQQDPIHVVMWDGKPAIMEGQRRWLVAGALGIAELEGFEHPVPDDLTEIYLYGRSIHASRAEPTAIDNAVVWGRMIDDGVIDQKALAVKCGLDTSVVSKSLSILKAGTKLIAEIKKAPKLFTARHLNALAQISAKAGEDRAIEEAKKVFLAPEDEPVSARSLEKIVERLSQEQPVKPTRKRSTQLAIRDSAGASLGNLQYWKTGKINFEPVTEMAEDAAEKMAEEIKGVISKYVQQQH